jgi:hypothetical protein
MLVETDLEGANLTSCSVYGISAWKVKLNATIQSDLVITDFEEPVIHVDDLEVAQFIYLLLNNDKVRDVIDTVTSKVVLILGRFTPERKAVLDALRDELRRRNYLPVLFDFQKPKSRSFTETVSTLAHMARFVVADLTDPRSIPQELMAIIPALPSVPVQPLLQASQAEYGMFPDFSNYRSVLEPFRYTDQGTLLAELGEKVIAPAENKANELSRIGKESDRRLEEGDELESLSYVPVEFEPPGPEQKRGELVHASETLIRKIRKIGIRALVRFGLSRRTLENICRRQLIPIAHSA